MVTPLRRQLKAAGRDTFTRALKTVRHYINLEVQPAEIELLKLILLSNTDSNTDDAKLSQPDLIHKMRSDAFTKLLHLCHLKSDTNMGMKRYNELLMSLTRIRDISTRLESTMCQQHEATLISSNIL